MNIKGTDNKMTDDLYDLIASLKAEKTAGGAFQRYVHE